MLMCLSFGECICWVLLTGYRSENRDFRVELKGGWRLSLSDAFLVQFFPGWAIPFVRLEDILTDFFS